MVNLALKLLLFFSFFILPSEFLFAESTEQRIFNPSFRTVQVQNPTNPLAPPVIILNSNDRLIVSFDEMASEFRQMKYSLVHCSASWEPSSIVETQYLDGFNEAKVNDFDYSRATLSHYVNYRIEIPDGIRPLLSGNYLLVVSDDSYPYSPVLQVRFFVSEKSVRIDGVVDGRTDIDYRDSHQQLSISLDTRNSEIDNPYTDIILTVEQNGRPETLRTITVPTRVEGSKVFYEHLRDLIFEAGNEYRRMEIVRTDYPSMGVDYVRNTGDGYFASLVTDFPKADDPYAFDLTQNGKFVIREYNSDYSDTESEYLDVLFSLEMPRLYSADVYIEGDLTDRRFDERSKMDYDPVSGRYQKILNLKQGAYNYQYIALPLDSSSPVFIDGNKYQTHNEYIVKVYYRKRGEFFDRLAGVSLIRFE